MDIESKFGMNLLNLNKSQPGTEKFKQELLELSKAGITHVNFDMAKIAQGEMDIDDAAKPDPSHDYLHTLRVLKYTENMSDIGQDRDVTQAAVIFHDLITRLKGNKNPEEETEQTAQYVKDLFFQYLGALLRGL